MKIGMFQFYNMESSGYGVPFALCETHEKLQGKWSNIVIPDACLLNKIADESHWPCVQCEEETNEQVCKAS